MKDYGPRFEMLTFTSDNPSAVQDLSGIPGVKGAAESLRFSAPKPVRPKPKSFQDAAAAAKPSKGPFKLPADAFGAAGVPKRRSRSMLQDELVCPPITLADSELPCFSLIRGALGAICMQLLPTESLHCYSCTQQQSLDSVKPLACSHQQPV